MGICDGELVEWTVVRNVGEGSRAECARYQHAGPGQHSVGVNTGVVYVFRRSRANSSVPYSWDEEVRLQPTTEKQHDEAPLHSNGKKAGAQYGYSVALSGPPVVELDDRIAELSGTYTLVVGAPEDDVAGDGVSGHGCGHGCGWCGDTDATDDTDDT